MPKGTKQKAVARTGAVLLASLFSLSAFALEISDRYRSPRNPERRVRQATKLIVLHTTEAPARSSLNKLCDRGEAHFCVTEEGQIYRIVDRDREAFHAGRSMWCGAEDVDKYSVGIECVGYHNKAMPTVQLVAIRDLVKSLKAMYRLSDDKVVAHSHVAYGMPNKWQRRRHRGRKRCGMLFAMPSVRRILNLKTRVAYDPDTRAGRLAVGDEYLQNVLYGNVDTMARAYGRGQVAAVQPASGSGGGWFSRLFGGSSKTTAAASRPSGTAAKARSAARKPAATVAAPKTVTQLKARGWVLKGVVTKANTAAKIAGGRWNASDTYYTIRDKVIPGSSLDPAKIEKGMGVWLRK